MQLLTPDPKDTVINEHNVWVLSNDALPHEINEGIEFVAKQSPTNKVLLWTATEMFKTTNEVMVVSKYKFNGKGEVLPA